MKGLEITAGRPHEKQMGDRLLGILACVLLLTGYCKVLFSGFPSVAEYWWRYAIACGGMAILLAFLLEQKFGKWILLSGFAGILFICLVQMSACTNGLCILGNDVLDYLTGRTGNVYLDFPVNGTAGIFLVPALAAAALTLMVSWFSYHSQLLPCCLLAALCAAGYGVGFLRVDYSLALLTAGLLLLIVYRYSRIASAKSLALTALGIPAVLLLCAIPAILVCSRLEYQVSFEQERNQIRYAAHKGNYDTGTDAMPEGNLVNVGAFEKGEETALILEVETPQKFYLRGMTGEIYTGSSWEGFGAEVYQENEELFYWLHKLEFYGQTILAQSGSMLPEAQEAQQLKITNVSACAEHLYLPYALADHGLLQAETIGDNRARGVEETTELSYVPGSVPQWYQTAQWLSQNQGQQEVSEYLKKEESYREFVYANDLQLTNSVVGVFERIFDTEERGERSLSEVLELVRKTLGEQLTYDERTVTDNGRNDFVRYTLEQSRRGYSTHYATIATLMLRYMGVPARYVEGYYLSAEEAAGYNPGEQILLTEAHAHAWTEYYMDGVGWIPFEVTPGYIDDEEWDETSLVIADGMGEGAGRAFTQSSLTYTPPKLPEQENDLPNLRSVFRFETKQVLLLALILLLLVLLLAFIWILRRYLRLKKFRSQVAGAGNREAVEELYGYAVMLMKKCRIIPEADGEEARLINEKARFGSREIEDEQRSCVEQFTGAVVETCKKQHSIWQKLKYRYILWLY